MIAPPQQMTGTVTAVSGTACMVTVLGADMPASVPLSIPADTVTVGASVVLFSVNNTWYVNAVLPPAS